MQAPEAPAEAVEEAEKKEVIARERALAVAGVVQAVVQAENEKAGIIPTSFDHLDRLVSL